MDSLSTNDLQRLERCLAVLSSHLWLEGNEAIVFSFQSESRRIRK